MTDAPQRRSGIVTFPGSPTDEHMVCAVLVTQSPETGEVHTFVRPGAGYSTPGQDLVEILAQDAMLQSLETTQERNTSNGR